MINRAILDNIKREGLSYRLKSIDLSDPVSAEIMHFPTGRLYQMGINELMTNVDLQAKLSEKDKSLLESWSPRQ